MHLQVEFIQQFLLGIAGEISRQRITERCDLRIGSIGIPVIVGAVVGISVQVPDEVIELIDETFHCRSQRGIRAVIDPQIPEGIIQSHCHDSAFGIEFIDLLDQFRIRLRKDLVGFLIGTCHGRYRRQRIGQCTEALCHGVDHIVAAQFHGHELRAPHGIGCRLVHIVQLPLRHSTVVVGHDLVGQGVSAHLIVVVASPAGEDPEHLHGTEGAPGQIMIIAGIRHTHGVGHQSGKRIGRHAAHGTFIQDVLSVCVGLQVIPAPAVVLLQSESEGDAVAQHRIAHFAVCVHRSCRQQCQHEYQAQQNADPLFLCHCVHSKTEYYPGDFSYSNGKGRNPKEVFVTILLFSSIRQNLRN